VPRFVILEHDHPFLHWDLMLESAGVLRTWRLLELPEPGQAMRAEPLGEHRILYLTYEGPISGNRGTVKRWDAGDYLPIDETGDRITLELNGARLSGTAEMRREGDDAWTFGIHNVRKQKG